MTSILVGASRARLDLRLFELDVLAHDRVVLLHDELVRRGLLVLRGRVEVPGVGGRHQTDQLASTLPGHGNDSRCAPGGPKRGCNMARPLSGDKGGYQCQICSKPASKRGSP